MMARYSAAAPITVETFPDQLTLGFIVHDHPCSIDLGASLRTGTSRGRR